MESEGGERSNTKVSSSWATLSDGADNPCTLYDQSTLKLVETGTEL